MVQVVIAIHVMVCITLVILILLQQGKGAEVGAVFGGSSNTVFGASGAGNVLSRATSGLAVLFFATSLYLAYTSSQQRFQRHVEARAQGAVGADWRRAE